MGKAILMDKILKLIVENISVTRADQISSLLNVDNNIVLILLKEMDEYGHIKLVRVGSQGVYVIILKPPGREFYKSSSYTELYKGTAEDKKPAFKISRKTLAWTIIGILAVILLALIVGYRQGWFS